MNSLKVIHKPAPVVLFVFNRPEHTRKTLLALASNEFAGDTDLIVYSDGPRNPTDELKVKEVREIFKDLKGFKSIELIERQTNLGLAQNIILGVTETLERYDRVIVLEDDLITSPYFLRYMNDGLNLYENCENVASIHAYVYPTFLYRPETFFIRGADCWGWGTWKRAWKFFNPNGKELLDELVSRKLTFRFNMFGSYPFTKMLKNQIQGKNNSWAIRWHASTFLKNMFTLYPRKSLIYNIGFDGSGAHCENDEGLNDIKKNFYTKPIELRKQKPKQSVLGLISFVVFFYKMRISAWGHTIIKKIKDKLK